MISHGRVPVTKFSPYILDELNRAGVNDDDIRIVSGLGSHRRQTEEEWQRLVGEEVFRRVTVEDSAGDDFTEVAVSRRGTPL